MFPCFERPAMTEQPQKGPKQLPALWSQILCIIIVSRASNRARNNIGNFSVSTEST